MPNALTPLWNIDESGGGPYPERHRKKVGAVDRFLTEALDHVETQFSRRHVKLQRLAAAAEALSPETAKLSDEELLGAARSLRSKLVRYGFLDELTAQSFALVREASSRRLGLRHYPVQMMGGFALTAGMMAEMDTGEGKTITAALAAATAALAGLPVHVITVNDYLAARDAALLKPVYDALGLSVSVVQHGDSPEDRRNAYGCHITYVVNKEVAFDYLRDEISFGSRRSRANVAVDRLVSSRNERRPLLRGLCFAIIDEADSVLVDEARTPLIISGSERSNHDEHIYATALSFADRLDRDADFELIGEPRSVRLTEVGRRRLSLEMEGLEGIWQARRAREDMIENALAARHLFHLGKHYIVADDKVHIIDEQTGRIAEGRSWQHGVHQLIEAKENCPFSSRHEAQASITYQNFFRRYLHLSGMSGTLSEVAAELRAVYRVKTARIPPHRPNRRVDHGLCLYRAAPQKWDAVVTSIKRHTAAGRPVLIGTRSVEASEHLSALLREIGIEHVVLNARQDKDEAGIVAQAGQPGRITVATNMAGRGTDIKLAEAVASCGGLHVILTEFHESSRVDRQLIGRGARQGDPGSFEMLAALDDDLFTTFGPRKADLGARLFRDGTSDNGRIARALRNLVQRTAERTHRRVRRQLLGAQHQLERTLAFSGRSR